MITNELQHYATLNNLHSNLLAYPTYTVFNNTLNGYITVEQLSSSLQNYATLNNLHSNLLAYPTYTVFNDTLNNYVHVSAFNQLVQRVEELEGKTQQVIFR